ncbi:class I SAM-dependent methyltransferase [Micromonospora sp. NPDC006766]|uniref:class I SAM-dependent methyltransferase n=1 Tax=Micromonospora sp. NPDC006766 TaxID=3154778 RepID=UPI0033E8F6E1
MTTADTIQPMPASLLELLDPVIRQELDRVDILPVHRVLEIGAGTGEITALLAHRVGLTGGLSAVDRDTSCINPTSKINVYQRELGRDALPGEAEGFDRIVARWLHGELPDPAAVLEQMIDRLSPGGWLILADITSTPPRVFRPNGNDAHLIRTVMQRLYHIIAPDGRATWTADIDTLLLDQGMVQICTHTSTETWTGRGPGCRLLADAVDQLRPVLIEPDLTNTDLDRFVNLMADPRVILGSYERRAIHARKTP